MNYLRQQGLFDPNTQNRTVTIIGCGSLGSVLAVLLAKIGFNEFVLYDADIVEAHNIPNQAFNPNHVGQSKVSALYEILFLINPDISVEAHERFFDADTDTLKAGIVVNAPDDIDVRKAVAEACSPANFIVDIRSGNDSFNVLFCDKHNTQEWSYYSSTFFSSDNVQGADCNAQSTAYTSHLIGSLALHQIIRHVNMKPYHLRIDGCLETLRLSFIR